MECGFGGKQGFLRRIKSNGSERDKLSVVQTEHNPFKCIRLRRLLFTLIRFGEGIGRCPDPKWTCGKNIIAYLWVHKNSGVWGRNDPQAFREEGIDRNLAPKGMGGSMRLIYHPL
jgi:hypothetical protein